MHCEYLIIRQQAQVVEAQPSWLSLIDNEGEV